MSSRTLGESTNHLTWDVSGGLSLLLSDGQTSYIYGPGGLPIEQIDAEEAPTYYHHDQLGSTRMLTNASGEATARFSYDAYGGLEASTGTQTTPLGYAGQYTLAQSGLQYLRARVYDPVTGQFLTRDPVEPLTRQPYTYAGDNPLSSADPTGLEAEELKVPCTWPCAPPPVVESLEEAAHKISNALDDAWNAIIGGENAEGHLTLSEAEAEYEEEHHECPLERNSKQDKKVTDQQLEEAGINPHELKDLGSGSDIYKDREGNLYEKPKGGTGPGEPLGVNINDLLR
jgi:RHS repeat-associated protein